MKFLVDELPIFDDECPFGKRIWVDKMWTAHCTLVSKRCTLYESRDSHECYGLKEKGANNE